MGERKEKNFQVAKEGFPALRRMCQVRVYHFTELTRHIEKKIETDDVEMAIRSAGEAVYAHVRLGMNFRYFACGRVWEIRSSFGGSTLKFYRSVWRVIDEINEEFTVDLDLTEINVLQELKLGFAKNHGYTQLEVR